VVEKGSHAVGPASGQDQIVFVTASRIGMTDEPHLSLGKRTGAEATNQLVECGVVDVSNDRGIESEVCVGVRDAARAPDLLGDFDDGA
jgi:hypothetical protein